MNRQNLLKKVLMYATLIYTGFGATLFFMQKQFIYFPNNQDFESCPGFRDYLKINHLGTRAYYLKQSESDVLVYYHGNAGSACDRSIMRSLLEPSEASLLFVEYAGYSNDDKKPSRTKTLQNVDNIANFMSENNYTDITIYGQSLGSGPASYHASKHPVDSVILVSPFSNFSDLAQTQYPLYPASILLTEKYDNQTWLQNYQNQLLIIHGDQDELIPPAMSKALFDSVPSDQKTYKLIPNRAHNDLWGSQIFSKVILKYISQ